MSKKMEKRSYNLADGNLKQMADGLKTSIVRDATEFETRNIKTPQIAAYQVLIDSFDETTTDEELKGLVTDAAEIKDGLAASIRKAIRTIRNMAEQAYNSKGKFSTFGFGDMGNMTHEDLYRLSRRVLRVAGKLTADLAKQGLTTTMLTDLGALATAFDKAIDDVEEAIENRDLETQDRIIKGNALYAEMVRLASIGKSLFEDENEAKYNDYVLIGSAASTDSGTTPTPPPAG